MLKHMYYDLYARVHVRYFHWTTCCRLEYNCGVFLHELRFINVYMYVHMLLVQLLLGRNSMQPLRAACVPNDLSGQIV